MLPPGGAGVWCGMAPHWELGLALTSTWAFLFVLAVEYPWLLATRCFRPLFFLISEEESLRSLSGLSSSKAESRQQTDHTHDMTAPNRRGGLPWWVPLPLPPQSQSQSQSQMLQQDATATTTATLNRRACACSLSFSPTSHACSSCLSSAAVASFACSFAHGALLAFS